MRGLHRDLAAAAVLLALACGENTYAPPPPPEVTVGRPEIRDVTQYLETTGTTRAIERVDVRARVKGFLQSVEYDPPDFVEAGQLLFVIDPEPFEVAKAAASADVARRRAEVGLALTRYERAKRLYEADTISELDYLTAKAEHDHARAGLAASRAALDDAQLDLDYAHVRAPIAGRVSKNLVDVGNLVGADGPTVLTDIVQYQPIHVYFQISENDLLALQRLIAEENETQDPDSDLDDTPTPLYVALADEEGYPHEGVVDYGANQIDSETGTFELRGTLPNDAPFNQAIVPGAFVRVRVPIRRLDDAILIPERALGADQGGRYVLVVNSDDVVEQRQVKLGQGVGDMRVVRSGVSPDDRIVVNGLQRARPGATVAPVEESAEASPEVAWTDSE